jgi:hypothetical protein
VEFQVLQWHLLQELTQVAAQDVVQEPVLVLVAVWAVV